MANSKAVDKYLNVLLSIESTVVKDFIMNPGMHDHDVLNVYEYFTKFYRAKTTNFPLPQPAFSGVQEPLYHSVLEAVEKHQSEFDSKEMMECLKMLKNSVSKWNKIYGSQGYLGYIRQFTHPG